MYLPTATPPVKKIRRRPRFNVRAAVRDWLLHDDAVKAFGERQAEARRLLMGLLEETGTTDEKGSQWIRFPDDPVEGRINSIKRERRVTRILDIERTEAYLKKRRLYDQCTETVVVLNEERILGLNFEGKISDEDLASLYDTNESWAFVPSRVKL